LSEISVEHINRMTRLIESAARDANDDTNVTLAAVLPQVADPRDQIVAASVIRAKVGFGHYRRAVPGVGH
jgi:hypothetical protein